MSQVIVEIVEMVRLRNTANGNGRYRLTMKVEQVESGDASAVPAVIMAQTKPNAGWVSVLCDDGREIGRRYRVELGMYRGRLNVLSMERA